MNYVLLILLFIILIFEIFIMIISRDEEIAEKYKTSKFIIPFYKAGSYLFKKTFGKSENYYYRKIFDKNSLIYAAKENIEITKNYFVEKLGLCFLVIFIGVLMVLVFLKTYSLGPILFLSICSFINE